MLHFVNIVDILGCGHFGYLFLWPDVYTMVMQVKHVGEVPFLSKGTVATLVFEKKGTVPTCNILKNIVSRSHRRNPKTSNPTCWAGAATSLFCLEQRRQGLKNL